MSRLIGKPGSCPLDHEQGIALGLAEDRLAPLLADVAAGDAPGEGGGLIRPERLELDLGRLVGRECLEDQPLRRVLGVELLGARRGDDEDRRRGVRAQEVTEPVDRLLIAPLHVVEDKEQRRLAGEHRARDALEQAGAVPPRLRAEAAEADRGGSRGAPARGARGRPATGRRATGAVRDGIGAKEFRNGRVGQARGGVALARGGRMNPWRATQL